MWTWRGACAIQAAAAVSPVSDRSESFEEGCLLAVNLGDDADTTAAIYGQLAGACYGIDGIPREWRDLIAQGELILGLADGIWEAAGQPAFPTGEPPG